MESLPLGVLSRSRRDWSIQSLRYGNLWSTGTGNTLGIVFALNSNDPIGLPLAVWGIRGSISGMLGLMVTQMVAGKQTGTQGNDFQLKVDEKAIPGQTVSFNTTVSWTPTNGIVFKADGLHWLENFDAPLFIVPQNFSVVVQPFAPLGVQSGGLVATCSFLWSSYTIPRLPQRATKSRRG